MARGKQKRIKHIPCCIHHIYLPSRSINIGNTGRTTSTAQFERAFTHQVRLLTIFSNRVCFDARNEKNNVISDEYYYSHDVKYEQQTSDNKAAIKRSQRVILCYALCFMIMSSSYIRQFRFAMVFRDLFVLISHCC